MWLYADLTPLQLLTLTTEKRRRKNVYWDKEATAYLKVQDNMKSGVLQRDSLFLAEHRWAVAHSWEGGGGCNHTYGDFLTPEAWIFLPYWQQWKGSLTFCSSVFNVHIIWTDFWVGNTSVRSFFLSFFSLLQTALFIQSNHFSGAPGTFWYTLWEKLFLVFLLILLILNLLQYLFLIKLYE